MRNHIKKNWVIYYSAIAFGIFIGMIISHVDLPKSQAVTIVPGYTFATNEVVTAAKLGTLVSGASITAIATTDLSDLIITNDKLGNNSVTTDKILDATIQGADISNRTITATLIATNAITGSELSTNIVHRSGFLVFTNANTSLNFGNTADAGVILSFTNASLGFSTNQISSGSVNGTSVSAGSGDAGKVVRLNSSGLVDPTMVAFSKTFTSTNCPLSASAISIVQAHSLGGAPTLVQARIINTSTELNYSANDEVIIALGGLDAGGNYGFSVVPDASNLNIRYSGAFSVPDKTTGTISTINSSKWSLIIRAWR